MNLLQTFLDAAQLQSRAIIREQFYFVGTPGALFYMTFGDPQVVPVMTRTGYQDHIVTVGKADASQWPTTKPTPKSSLVRVSNGRTYFVQSLDAHDPVVLTFLLTDREL